MAHPNFIYDVKTVSPIATDRHRTITVGGNKATITVRIDEETGALVVSMWGEDLYEKMPVFIYIDDELVLKPEEYTPQ